MRRINLRAMAKINLSLDVVGTRSDGYHDLRMVMQSVRLSDQVTVSPKSKKFALILCIFLVLLGVHYFYVGRKGKGILYLCTLGLVGIGWIIDIIAIATGGFEDANGYPLKV